jgi:hypothetical protein
VDQIIGDANASLAAKGQVDTFYSKEVQEERRAKKRQAEADEEPSTATAPTATGAGKLPVTKRTAEQDDDIVEEVQKHWKTTHCGASGSGLKRGPEAGAEDLRSATTDIEQLMEKVVRSTDER